MLWRARSKTIRRTILRSAWNPKRQAFTDSLGGSDLDASVLLMGEMRPPMISAAPGRPLTCAHSGGWTRLPASVNAFLVFGADFALPNTH